MAQFPSHEMLTLKGIEHDLVGDTTRPELLPVFFEELRHRANLKLSIGERVVVNSADFDELQLEALKAVAQNQGASIIELDSIEPDLQPTKPMYLDTLKQNWKGVTVVGDIHGDYDALMDAFAWAHSRQHFTWLLGDVIDYGPKVLETMSAVYSAVMNGEAALILGNHERKIAKWLDQKEHGKVHVRISEGNRVTVDALNKLSTTRRRHWIGQFRSLLAHASLICQMNDVTLVHAAIHPSYWSDRPDDAQIEKFALYGEADFLGGKFRRVHRWIDHVPQEKMVFVGHDVLHSYPTVKTGEQGGQIVFLDTGCGKGGSLSSADLRFTSNGLKLECFRRY